MCEYIRISWSKHDRGKLSSLFCLDLSDELKHFLQHIWTGCSPPTEASSGVTSLLNSSTNLRRSFLRLIPELQKFYGSPPWPSELLKRWPLRRTCGTWCQRYITFPPFSLTSQQKGKHSSFCLAPIFENKAVFALAMFSTMSCSISRALSCLIFLPWSIETILTVLHHPRWPRQVQSSLAVRHFC